MWKYLILFGLIATQAHAQPANILSAIDAATLIPPVQQTRDDDRRQTLCLALALYYEARGESQRGQRAVGDAILNRILASRSSVCQTLWQHAQFPWTRYRNLKPHDLTAWRQVQEIALHLRQRRWPDITHGATLFYNPRLCHPRWASRGIITARIGDHVFIRP